MKNHRHINQNVVPSSSSNLYSTKGERRKKEENREKETQLREALDLSRSSPTSRFLEKEKGKEGGRRAKGSQFEIP